MNQIELAGTSAGFISTLFFFPIDTIKSRIQANQYPISSRYTNLFKGITPELTSNTISSFAYWSIYKTSRNYYNPVISSVISCTLSNIIDSPLDYIKKQKQLGIQYKFNNFFTKQFMMYSFLNTTYSVVYNVCYMNMLSSTPVQKRNKIISLCTASTVSAIISYPIDYYRTLIVSKKHNTTISSNTFFKGLFMRLLYANLYSPFYMYILLSITDNQL
jgi:hypothetical protein